MVVMALLGLASAPAMAKDINLGGKRIEGKGDKQKGPLQIIELPPILVAIRRADGGYNHIQIEAWLAPKDEQTALDLDAVRTSISRQAREEELPRRGFEALKKPSYGTDTAKMAIHDAAEHTLGHPWNGEVFIRTMLLY